MGNELSAFSIPLQLSGFVENAEITKSFVTENHQKAIADYCKRNHIALAVRQTGELSLQRIEMGAKAKPHTILEKSIKSSSLRKKHPKISAYLDAGKKNPSLAPEDLTIRGAHIDELKGFVGHWSKEGELLGLRLDAKDVLGVVDPLGEGPMGASELEKLQKFITIDTATQEPYIRLEDFDAFKKQMGNEYAQQLYTGDYDLSEIYKHHKPLMEGSREKARILEGMNEAIAQRQEKDPKNTMPIRRGGFGIVTSPKKLKGGRGVTSHLTHIRDGSEYAMFQHGDQMGYLTNQVNESIADLPDEGGEIKKADLVRSVSEEPDEPLAWCVKGQWYLTANRQEHQEFRDTNNLTVSSAWSPKTPERIRDKKSRVFQYKT
ncbi:MAG: hypothetical protein AAGB24_10140 [Bacteroidota bacterium]